MQQCNNSETNKLTLDQSKFEEISLETMDDNHMEDSEFISYQAKRFTIPDFFEKEKFDMPKWNFPYFFIKKIVCLYIFKYKIKSSKIIQ